MRYISLTKGQVALVDDSDYEWLSQWRWQARWHKRRLKWNAQRSKRANGRKFLLHMSRVIMDAPTGLMVDHINGDTLDNQRHNLRLATNQQNQHNQTKLRTDNTTGYKGVTQIRSGNYLAQLYLNKVRIRLGVRVEKREAAILYNEGALKYFGEFAALNRIEQGGDYGDHQS